MKSAQQQPSINLVCWRLRVLSTRDLCSDVTGVYAAILPRRWRWPEEDLLGEEPRPAVAALRLVSVHAGHRQAHQEVCPVAERSGYVLYSRSVGPVNKYRLLF